ncbi:GLE1-like protein [Cordyceps fumosorosea ARSEF 2679]|uniref:mRNA export factor GLE1 n=1 Tax=Cordyceps fumosorosea (strain ARSEF 2679) TaxID=1081104 RepID=A0A162LL97_CORFA|nr:GLE1-like protein [Cordyceps fumosorosea ARSEF 2679]OAA72264.1 GLE1-like protein [Cordyceps fumosorosea ARSEF 2679]
MSRSSPARGSQHPLSSPERSFRSSFLFDTRNDELSHLDALAAAQAEHDRVRAAAMRVYEMHELKEESERIHKQQEREKERLKAEADLADKERKLQELQAKTIPKPAPPPEPKHEAVKPVPSLPANPAERSSVSEPRSQPGTVAEHPVVKQESQPPAPKPQTNGFGFNTIQPGQPAGQLQQGKPASNLAIPIQNIAQPKPQPPAVQPTQRTPGPPKPAASTERYVQIHQELKKLRVSLQAAAKVAGSPLKGTMGEYRREIRVSIGQLTSGRGANKQPIDKIIAALRDALQQKVPSPPIEVGKFVVHARQPVEGAAHNDDTLPALFIYLVNICAKAIINQFINECGANPKAADPIGIFTAHVFSMPEFLWRGASLIDILMAKFRITCPVLFGLSGSDKTERGRLALGWRKDGPAWITEQSHNDRMAGLAAGYAAVSLRDFSRSSKKNPYPPSHYWTTLAGIVNCPAGQTSNTQYIVVRYLIDGHEQRFFNFFGNAALAALRLALVEFPKRAPGNSPAAGSLQALAEVLKSTSGLILA